MEGLVSCLMSLDSAMVSWCVGAKTATDMAVAQLIDVVRLRDAQVESRRKYVREEENDVR